MSAAAELLKPIFFLRCCVSGSWGFIYECPLHYPPQLGGSLVTICLLRLHPADVGSTLLLQALPCSHRLCRKLCPAATCFALQQSLSVMAGCLGNNMLHQQWECTSVGADCLGNGRRPSPTELHHPGFSCACSETLNPERFKSLFCLSLWGWDPPSLITWLPASEPCFFFKLNG